MPFLPAHLSLVEPVAFPLRAPESRVGAELALVYGRLGALDGVALSGAALAVRGQSRGVVIAAAAAYTGSAEGLLVAGAANLAGPVEGALVAPANVSGALSGASVGVGNVAGDVDGAQVGVVNVAGDVRGLQVGLVNVARDVRGLQLGLVNVARNGRVQGLLATGAAAPALVGVRSVSAGTVTELTLGGDPRGEAWVLGALLGAHLAPGPLVVEPGLGVTSRVPSAQTGGDGEETDARARLRVGVRLLDAVEPFVAVGISRRIQGSSVGEQGLDWALGVAAP